jgi:Holliday junction resolvase RusA-like endonuclease
MNHRIEIPAHACVKERPKYAAKKCYTPKRTRLWENYVRIIAKRQIPNDYPIKDVKSITIEFYGVKRGDLDNYVKSIMDSLNGIAYQDDKQIYRLQAEWFSAPREQGHVVIFIR